MRKTTVFALVLLVLLLLVGSTALAESFTFDTVHATCEVSDDYIILTPANLSLHPEWLANRGLTLEDTLAKWEKRGVLLQAWNQEGDMCIEISAVQDEHALTYWDINAVTTDDRYVYRTSHLKDLWYTEDGYEFLTTEWKNTQIRGRFLLMEYTRTAPGDTYAGYMRRTVRNGYTITLECQVYGRKPKAADSNALDKVLGTWEFSLITDKPTNLALPSSSSADSSETASAQQPLVTTKTAFTSKPPAETATGSFKVAGTTEPSAHLIGVLMRMSTPGSTLLEVDADKKGKFNFDVQLPSEGVWNMTITATLGDQVIEEIMFDNVITYSKNLLYVNLDEPLPTVLTEDKLVISGTTVGSTKVQCIVGDSYNKTLTATAAGSFKFTIDTSLEGTYDIVLTFEKKNYDMRRLTASATRTLTEEESRQRFRDAAVKPAYSNLVEKITGYTGRILTYSMYVTDIMPTAAGDQWVIFMAMDYSAKSGYKNYVAVTTSQEPQLEIGSQHRLYGKCTGTWEVQSEGSVKYYPCIDLLFWED